MMAMPAAELFGCIVVPQAAARAARTSPSAVYAVGDCQPAAAAITSGVSATPQMQSLLTEARRWCSEWAGVAVRREHNTDADLLSHPAQAIKVALAAAAAGLLVHEAVITETDWSVARAAAALGLRAHRGEADGAGSARTGANGEPTTTAKTGDVDGGTGAERGHTQGGQGRSLDLHRDDPLVDVRAEGWKPREENSVALVIFAAEDERKGGLPAQYRQANFDTVAVDTKIGGADHDALRSSVRARIEEWLRSGTVAVIFMAPPCESFSVAHRPQLRSARWADGIKNVPPEWRAYIRKHNKLAETTMQLASIAAQRGILWWVENPADRGVFGTPPYWQRMKDHGSMWRFSATRRLRDAHDTVLVTFAQCSLPDGADVQKYTSLLASRELDELCDEFRGAAQCSHSSHAVVAHGRDAFGRGRAELAAAYPLGLSRAIAVASRAALEKRAAREGGVAGGAHGHTLSMCSTCDA